MLDDVEFTVELRKETEFAYLFFEGSKEVWIPKSVIRKMDQIKKSKTYEISVPYWFAKKRELF